jgi:hypothetical protein
VTDWRWPNFRPEEADGGVARLEPTFLDRLQDLRTAFGWPMMVTSAYRTPVHNAWVSSTGLTGPHTTGRAVDIAIFGDRAYQLVTLATQRGFTGIGLNQKGALAKRFIHLDDLTDAPGCPRPRLWTYRKEITMKGWKTVVFGIAIGALSLLSGPDMQAFVADHLPEAGAAIGLAIVILRAVTSSPIFKKDT